MALIYETNNFIVESAELPHVSREEGGHVRILPKVKVLHRVALMPALAIELMRLTMVVGQAMAKAMNDRGVSVIRINYHDMGNWALKTGDRPYFHLQVYGRAKDAVHQPCQEAVYLPDRSTGFYNDFKPLNEDDIKEIRKQIESIFKQDKYQDVNWNLH